MSGPFVLILDDKGREPQDMPARTAFAVKQWAPLDAFTVCYRRDSLKPANRNTWAALRRIAAALKSHGAKSVVMPSGGGCERHAPELPRRPHIEIMGVVGL